MLVNLVVEIQNRQSLEIMLAREEEVKRRAIIHKEIYNGPQIRYISRNGGWTHPSWRRKNVNS